MADKTTQTRSQSSGGEQHTLYNPYAEDFEAGPYGIEDHKPSWIDGFPHHFHGWGPQTPEPDSDHARPQVGDELTWRERGEVQSRHHVIWRFDRSRHH